MTCPDLWLNFSQVICERTLILLCSRGGGCSFEQKIRRATVANPNKYGDRWSAVIVHNEKGKNNLVPMAGGDDDLLPSTFMG